jgi:putative phosphoesterase
VRILVTADTHGHPLPAALLRAAGRAGLILHAGDALQASALDALRARAPLHAVSGNCDPPDLGLPDRLVLEVAGCRIGLTHGHLGRGRSTPERALSAFAPGEVQAVVFGHSHMPLLERRGGVLLLNPGSATERRRAPQPSFAWLEVAQGGRLGAEIVALPAGGAGVPGPA